MDRPISPVRIDPAVTVRDTGLSEATGSTLPQSSCDPRSWSSLPIARPAPNKRAIAHILGTLDDKIELNRRMNETLEAMARALFKSWFVDFDPVRAKAEGRDPGLPPAIADLFPGFLRGVGVGGDSEGVGGEAPRRDRALSQSVSHFRSTRPTGSDRSR